MSKSSSTDSTDASGSILRSFSSLGPIGIILVVTGAYGSLVLSSYLSMVLAGLNGVGAILIFTSDSTTSTNTAGYFFAVVSWGLMALNGMTTRVAIPTLFTAFWFGFQTERKIWAERINA